MSKKSVTIFLFLVLSLALVSSVDITIKDEFKLGENFVMKVSGSFYTQPTTADIKFYRDGVKTSFGIIDLEKIEGEYYFFLEVPLEKEPGNYTVVIENAEYNSGREVIEEDIESSFIILDEIVPFSISPPLVITSEDYDIEIQNLMDTKISVDLEKTSKVSEEDGTVDSEGFLDILFGLFESDDLTNETEPISENIVVEEPTSGSVISLISGQIKTLHEEAPLVKGFQMLELYYDGAAYGVMVYSPNGKPEIVVKDDEDDEADNLVEENETINESEAAIKEIEMILNEKGIDEESVNITEDGKVIDKETGKEFDLYLPTCAEQNGTTCGLGKKCVGEKLESLAATDCCAGTCEVIQKSSTGKVIGWFIIAAIAIFLTWFFKQKYKKAGPKKVDIIEASKPKSLRI